MTGSRQDVVLLGSYLTDWKQEFPADTHTDTDTHTRIRKTFRFPSVIGRTQVLLS